MTRQLDSKTVSPKMSSPILNYQDISIYESDLFLLSDGQWLNDVCINFCFAKKRVETNNSTILMMDPSVVSFLTFQVSDDEERDELAEGLSLTEKEWLIVPVNDCTSLGGSSSHWSLLVCHTTSGFAVHFDSNNHYNTSSARNVADKLTWLLQR